MKGKGLTDKQKRFAHEYLVDYNATQAAIRARYSPATAQQQSSRLLLNVLVLEEIERRKKQIMKKLEITQERVLEEYAKLAFADISDIVKWGRGGINVNESSTLDREHTAAISKITETRTRDSITVEVKMHDKKGALDSIARHLGMFKDSLNITTPVDVKDARTQLAEKLTKRTSKAGSSGSDSTTQQ